jgi:hypothetical protein
MVHSGGGAVVEVVSPVGFVVVPESESESVMPVGFDVMVVVTGSVIVLWVADPSVTSPVEPVLLAESEALPDSVSMEEPGQPASVNSVATETMWR